MRGVSRTILDAGLPHGRLWVMESGCECDECLESRRRRAWNAHAETRDLESREIPRQEREAGVRWGRPRWTKLHGRWVVTEPPNEDFVPGTTTNVWSVHANTTKEVHLGSVAGSKEVEPGVHLRVFRPAR